MSIFCCRGAHIEGDVVLLVESNVESPKWEGMDNMVLHILSFLDVSEVVLFQRVNKRWKGLCLKAIQDNFQPKREFPADGEELKDNVEIYCKYEVKHMNEIALVYGYPINRWLVGKVENFSYVFYCQKTFNEYIGDWNMSRARNLEFMFFGCRAFNQDIGGWDTANVDAVWGMIARAVAFDQDCLSQWELPALGDAWETRFRFYVFQLFEDIPPDYNYLRSRGRHTEAYEEYQRHNRSLREENRRNASRFVRFRLWVEDRLRRED